MRMETPHRESQSTVLVPIDFSSVSKTAMMQAIVIGGDNARMILLHVVPQATEAILNRKQQMEAAHSRLIEYGRAHAGDHGERFKYEIRSGSPYQEILTLAKQEDVQLIVIGVESSSSLGRVALGHTADRVSRYAHCPVLLVRESEPRQLRSEGGCLGRGKESRCLR
jgi:nucleotide-binding universal stress UspA family protein